jgi:hypothetical protein|tara:strand:+ start:197 stop:559 length:363 start_codon:yes stop_codon:yes gene_type:complete
MTANSKPRDPKANKAIVIPKLPLFEKVIGLTKALIGNFINFNITKEHINIIDIIKIAAMIMSCTTYIEDFSFIRVLNIKHGAPTQVIILVISDCSTLLPILFHMYPRNTINTVGTMIGNS